MEPAVHQTLKQAPFGENTDCWQVWFTLLFWLHGMILNMASSGAWLMSFFSHNECSCIRGQITRTRKNNRRKSICMSQPLSMKQVAKVTFSQLKLNPPEHILPAREKNSLEKAAFLNKGYSYIHSFIHSTLKLMSSLHCCWSVEPHCSTLILYNRSWHLHLT